MNTPLKQAVRQQVEANTLSEEQLQRLVSFADRVEPQPDRRIPWLLAAAAACVIVFMTAFLVSPYIGQPVNMHERIALEVASNHIKLKPLEIETGSMQAVRNYFDKLDFVPATSTLVNASGLQLMGGRYCSLQGITAAQLRLTASDSTQLQTLYMTEYVKDVFEAMPILEQGEAPVEVYVKGVRVKIWVEKGLLFALTDISESGSAH